MARRTLLALFLAAPAAVLSAALLAGSMVGAEQPAGAPNGHAPTQPDSIAHVTLGQSAVPLYGPWKFTVGDSPIDPKTGQPLWAEPDFDDSKWERVSTTAKNARHSPLSVPSGYVPGG